MENTRAEATRHESMGNHTGSRQREDRVPGDSLYWMLEEGEDEGEMSDPEAQINSMITAKNLINISKDIQVEFYQEDPIFSLSGAVPESKYTNLDQCHSCNKEFTKNVISGHCKFCGNSCCSTCLRKKRPFPRKNPKKREGRICVICDRKFFMRAACEEYIVELDM